MPATASATAAVCPECDAALTMPEVVLVGELLPCASCGNDLEVTATTPLALALAPEVEEDWGE